MIDEYLYLVIAIMYFTIAAVHLYDLWHDPTKENYILEFAYIGLVIFYILLWRDHLALLLKLKK